MTHVSSLPSCPDELADAIAVIGMAGRFPGADTLAAFWQMILSGTDGVRRFTREELAAAGVPQASREHPDYVPAAAILEGVDLFDASLFGIPAQEAALIDPQHRLFLTCAWEALEGAGYPPGDHPLPVGVFAGSSLSTYLSPAPGDAGGEQGAARLQRLIGNDKDYLTTRVSHRLNLTGPSVAVQTACSTSLVAVHLACQSLLSGECDMALAGGVSITLPQTAGYRYQDGLILSPDGCCRPFDAAAGGTLNGNGVGAVLLKPLPQALRDGDIIHAVIRGSAVTNDGSGKAGYTAPSVSGELRTIREALAVAGVGADSIGYVEAHGTGTALGDPIEMEALTRVFRLDGAVTGGCAVGSVKANIGHLDAAAGVTSLIKAVLAVREGMIPPLAHFTALNPRIAAEQSPFRFPTTAEPWPDGQPVRRAGVSSFGFGGTNVHLVIEQAPSLPVAVNGEDDDQLPVILPLSARLPDGVTELAARYRQSLEGAVAPAALAWTAACHRRSFAARAVVVVPRGADAGRQMQDALRDVVPLTSAAAPRVAFQFSGQGGLYPGVAAELYRAVPAFRAAFEALGTLVPAPVRAWLLSPASADLPVASAIVQPGLLAYQLAQVGMWQRLGVEPQAVLGHSVGEVAAAVVAGLLTPAQAMALATTRGELADRLAEPGLMVAILAPEAEVSAALVPYAQDVALATVNGPAECVIAGRQPAVAAVVEHFHAREVVTRPLRITHPFHAPTIEPLLEPLAAAAPVSADTPRLPFYAGLLGRPWQSGEVMDGAYWARHLRQTVRYDRALPSLLDDGYDVVLEIGPHATLTRLGRQQAPATLFVSTVERGRVLDACASALAALWLAGADLVWSGALQPQTRVSAPTYPFAPERHWHPQAGRLSGSGRDPWPEMCRAAGAFGQAAAALVEPDQHPLREQNLEALCAAGVARAFAALGFRDGLEATALCQVMAIAAPHHDLVCRLLDGLETAGRIERDGGVYRALRVPDEDDMTTLRQQAEPLWQVWGAMKDITLRAIDALPAMLRGTVNPREVLFGDGSLDEARAVYSELPNSRYFNGLIREAVRAFLAAEDGPGPLRLLEIGGGTAATTERLLPLLPPDRTTYTFTDISPVFLNAARRRFLDYPFLHTARFDVSRDPVAQGLEAGGQDMVVAANVMHAAADLGEAVANARRLLRPGGLFLLYEITRPNLLGEITTGLLMDPVRDTDRRGLQPMVDEAGWRRVLAEQGFEAVEVVPAADHPAACLPERVILARLSASLASGEQSGHQRDDVFYATRWEPAPAAALPPSLAGQQWVLLVAEAETGTLWLRALQDALRETGAEVCLIHDLTSAEAVAGAVRALPTAAQRRVIDLRAALPLPDLPLPELQRHLCGGLLHVLAGFEAAGVALGTLAVVTRGAQAVAEGHALLPDLAPLWGMARVVALGHPELACRQLDLPLSDEVAAADLLASLADAASEPLLALRPEQGGLWRPRVQRQDLQALPPQAAPLAADGWQVIAGGFGGLGMTLAVWLAEHGARRIALLGRSAPSPEAAATIARLRQQGVTVAELRADLTDPATLERAFDQLEGDICGLYHCAVTRTLPVDADSDPWAAFGAVMAPKVEGAWALHRLSLERRWPLEAFVLFSSSVSVVPAYGLPHYVAANSFLDALAQARQAQGLPAQSISWGAWLEVGAVADPAQAEHLRRGGLRGFRPAEGLALFARVRKRACAHLAVMDVDWTALLRQYAKGGIPPVFAAVAGAVRSPVGGMVKPDAIAGTGRDEVFLARLQAAGSAERAESLLRDWLRGRFGRLLNRPAERISDQGNLIEQGLDSLMFIEMSGGLGTALGVRLSPSELLRTFTVAGIAASLTPRLWGGKGDAPEVAPEPEVDLPSLLQDRPHDRHLPFPLTDVQQAYWIGRRQELELGNVACQGYTEFDCLDLDIPRLQRAWQTVIDRHEMLRVVIGADGQQRILSDVPPYRFACLDLRDLDPLDREQRLADLRHDLSHKVRDPACWPLFDIRVSLIDDQRTRLHVGIDNVAIDGRSIGIVLAEWSALYFEPALVLPAVPLSFRDYVLAFDAYRQTAGYQRARRYWLDRLPDLPPAPDLPLWRDPESIDHPRFVRHHFRLDAGQWGALKAAAAGRGMTAAGVLLAAYGEVLGRWSKSPRLTINAPVFTRLPVHPAIQDVVGEFTSNVLVGLDTAGGSFAARAQAAQHRLLSDLHHSVVSGIEVVRAMMKDGANARGAAMPVVFTSTFGLAGTADTSFAHHISAFSRFGQEVFNISQTPQVWLDNHVHDLDGGLGVNWDVVEGLFAPGVIEAMFAAYHRLLQGLAEGPALWEAVQPVALPADQQAERVAVNATAADLGPDELLHRPLLAQALRTPDAVALITPHQSLTYGEMAGLALGLAGQLSPLCQKQGPHVPLVAVALPKGWEQVVAVLAVHLAGAAYVPLDPDLPPARRAVVLAEAAPVAVITSAVLAVQDWSGLPLRLVEEARCLPLPAQVPPARQRPDDLAYVIFTSGSTGTPKGVMMDHRAVLNTVRDINQRHGVGPQDAVFALSSLSFDLSVYDIFGPLACGGRLVIPSPADLRNPQAWVSLLRQHPVTLWNSVPALWQMLVEYGAPIPAPRLAMLSGDWIPLDLPPKSQALFPTTTLESLGGATEAAIWSIAGPVPLSPLPGWRSVPYGRPLRNQGFHVLREDFSECPRHVPGQLFISGVGLAQGYWNDRERTAAQFVTNPHTGERLYRTGDLGRWREGGVIEFLGREDHQVKIAGHRIELGDIEAALIRHPAVAQAVVDAVGETPARRRLAAFVVPGDPAQPPLLADLRSHLASLLPAYMVPGLYALIDAVPLSANGKLDRRRLPVIATEDRANDDTSALSVVEQRLAAAWQVVLGTSVKARSDSFFEIGGNSLLAVRLVNHLRTRCALDLPLRTVFSAPRLGEMAGHLVPLTVAADRTPLCLSAGQDGVPVYCLGDTLADTQAFADLAAVWQGRSALWAVPAVMAAGEAPADVWQATVDELAAAIVRHADGGPLMLMGFSAGGLLSWDLAAVLRQQGVRVEQVVLVDSQPLPPDRFSDPQAVQALIRAATGQPDDSLTGTLGDALAAAASAALPPLAVPVTLVLADAEADSDARAACWQVRSRAGLTLCRVSGGHFDCLRAPQVAGWEPTLRHHLDEAPAPSRHEGVPA